MWGREQTQTPEIRHVATAHMSVSQLQLCATRDFGRILSDLS